MWVHPCIRCYLPVRRMPVLHILKNRPDWSKRKKVMCVQPVVRIFSANPFTALTVTRIVFRGARCYDYDQGACIQLSMSAWERVNTFWLAKSITLTPQNSVRPTSHLTASDSTCSTLKWVLNDAEISVVPCLGICVHKPISELLVIRRHLYDTVLRITQRVSIIKITWFDWACLALYTPNWCACMF